MFNPLSRIRFFLTYILHDLDANGCKVPIPLPQNVNTTLAAKGFLVSERTILYRVFTMLR